MEAEHSIGAARTSSALVEMDGAFVKRSLRWDWRL